MVQSQRKAHRYILGVMAVIVPAIFALGLAKRSPRPPEPGVATTALGRQEIRRPTGLLATSSNDRHFHVRLLKPLSAPDPLLYCSPSSSQSNHLPSGAFLFGNVEDGTNLPGECVARKLVLYSLGHQQVIDQLPLRARP